MSPHTSTWKKRFLVTFLCILLSSLQSSPPLVLRQQWYPPANEIEDPRNSIFVDGWIHGQFKDSFLANATTFDLASAVLHHSIATQLMVHSSVRYAFFSLCGNLNGMRELLSRDDMGTALVQLFCELAPKHAKDTNVVYLWYLSILLKMPEVYYHLSASELNVLHEVAMPYYLQGEGFATPFIEGIKVYHEPVDTEVIAHGSTEDLVDAILNSRLSQDAVHAEHPRWIFENDCKFDQGLQELLRRDNAAMVLIETFLAMNVQEMHVDSSKATMLALLVNQQEFALPKYRNEILAKLAMIPSHVPQYSVYFQKAAADCNSPYQH